MGAAVTDRIDRPSFVKRWLLPVDHKDIGTLYLCFSGIAGLFGAVLSLATGLQPSGGVTQSAHGLVLIFFMLMPALIGGFGNWFVPLLIGASNTAFPRMNVLSFGLLITAFALFVASLWGGEIPVIASLFLSVLASLLGAVNLIVTIVMMRTRGMGFIRMPAFAWAMLITAFVMVMALPVLAAAVTVMVGEGAFAAGSLPDVDARYRPLWLLGYPMIYVMVLPALGIICQVVPTFAKRPLAGYAAMVFAMATTGLIGFVVWAQQLFGSPLSSQGFLAVAAALAVAAIGIGAAALIATLWRAPLRLETPMLFALGALLLFAFGGITGALVAGGGVVGIAAAGNFVALFHHLLALGSAFAAFAGFYYWFPRMTGRVCNEVLGRTHFGLLLAAVIIVFLPPVTGGEALTLIGICFAAASVVAFVTAVAEAVARQPRVAVSPWGEGATTLEWGGR